MSEYRTEKFYWFKLKDDFFKRHDIKIIKAMPNGKDYVLFYLQLLCESLSHDGCLRFNEEVPYNEEMLSVITDTNIDVVRSAMKLFLQLNLIEIMDDKTIYLKKLQNMVGSTTIGAEKKQIQRNQLGLKSKNLLGGGQKADKCPLEIEIEKDIEIEKEKDIYINNINNKEQTNKLSEPLVDFENWQQVVAEIKDKISMLSFETFIQPIKCLGSKENVLYLSASNLTIKGAENFRDRLLSAIQTITNGEIVSYVWQRNGG